ncbi:MAG: hypothetical protein C0402_04130 [Thermodesulfovibrio sp.]|nr:hypothetical protein [Thermodesulfovibrio sp.]
MKQLIDVLIMVVNYSHDTATAFLAVSVLAMWDLSRRCPDTGDAGLELYYIRVYKRIARMAKYALSWILLTSLPRTLYYAEYEAFSAAGDLQVLVISAMHAVMIGLLASGLYYWLSLAKKVKALMLRHKLT